MPPRNTSSGGIQIHFTNGTLTPPASVVRLLASRYTATTIITVAAAGAMIVDQSFWPSFAVVAKYLMIATETSAITLRMPTLPISGAQVPRYRSAPSVVVLYH